MRPFGYVDIEFAWHGALLVQSSFLVATNLGNRIVSRSGHVFHILRSLRVDMFLAKRASMEYVRSTAA